MNMQTQAAAKQENSTRQLREIIACEVCGNARLEQVLDLGAHPMCDDLVPIGESRLCREYPIEILYCATCCTAHQRFQVPKDELFPTSYHYRSRFTADVLLGMEHLVNSCEEQFGRLSGKKVLDIGCNDGSLLDAFARRGAQTIGIEPTGACTDARAKGHTSYEAYLSPAIARRIVAEHQHPDFITFTNVFAHIENLPEVLDALRILMSATSVLVIENHYLGAVLARNQFDTFYHEHPRSYSYTSFVHMAKSLGATILHSEFPLRYGGNIRIFIRVDANGVSDGTREEIRQRERMLFQEFRSMRNNVHRWQTRKKALVEKLVSERGKIRAKAFPGRAAILIKLLELDENQISAVYEKPGSLKIGYYVPGTRIPIRSDNELFASVDKGGILLNLAWHIPDEIRSYLAGNGFKGQLIDILDPGDFAA